MTRIACWAVLGAIALAACGATGGNVITFDVAAAGVDGGSMARAANGWQVALTRAKLHIGAVYLNLSVPISVSQETNCIQPGVYTAEELTALDVDVLSPTPQLFCDRAARTDCDPATGTDDEARTVEVWLTGGDINADTDATVIADITGTASKGAQVRPFSTTATISTANRGDRSGSSTLPGSHPICKQRIVSPILVDLRPHEGGTLSIRVDTAAWFSTVDFDELPADGVLPDNNANLASQHLIDGIRAATTAFHVSFQ